MKELSIEEKAKAYDGNYKAYTELINRLEDVKDAIKKQNYGIAMDILCKPYPGYKITISTELKESEDEKIRKYIIDYFKGNKEELSEGFKWNGITVEEVIAWLEKQGEQKQETNYPKFDFDDILALQCCMETAEKVQKDKELYEKLKSLHSRLHDVYWIEKQGEQKSYVSETMNEKEDFDNGFTRMMEKEQKTVDKVEPKFKVGDKIIEKDFDECGCGTIIDIQDGKYIFDNGGFIYIEEQGLWKLVEQKPADWSAVDLPEFESYLCLMFQKFRTKGVCTNGEIVDFVKEHSQKLKDTLCHVWSEEDEKRLQSCLNILQAKGLMGVTDTINSKWLKSLKDRILPQPKQEWSKEDKDAIAQAILALESMYDPDYPERHYAGYTLTFDKAAERLKSLRPQNTWKPSDEQMIALQEAMNIVGILTITGSKINSLYQDLKKLREE